MTPQQKAQQLIMKFSAQLPFYSEKDNLRKSKECALIAVDLILNDCGAKDWLGDKACDGKNYWQEVKKQIETY